VTQLVPVPRRAAGTRPSPDARQLVDAATGVVGGTVGAAVGVAVSLVRTGSRLPVLRSRTLWHPAFLPSRYQPGSLVAAAARRGEEQEFRAMQHLERMLDTWTPRIADAVITRLDLGALVEQVLAEMDLPALIRESTGSMASETVHNARMAGISADEAINRVVERHLFRRRRSADSPVAPT
jgi:hypothetical protein